MISDNRQTSQVFKNQKMSIHDNWRMKGDYSRSVTNKKDELWVGQTIFHIVKHDSIGLNKKLPSGGKHHVTLCTGCRGMSILSQDKMFAVPRIRAETMSEDYPKGSIDCTHQEWEGNRKSVQQIL